MQDNNRYEHWMNEMEMDMQTLPALSQSSNPEQGLRGSAEVGLRLDYTPTNSGTGGSSHEYIQAYTPRPKPGSKFVSELSNKAVRLFDHPLYNNLQDTLIAHPPNFHDSLTPSGNFDTVTHNGDYQEIQPQHPDALATSVINSFNSHQGYAQEQLFTNTPFQTEPFNNFAPYYNPVLEACGVTGMQSAMTFAPLPDNQVYYQEQLMNYPLQVEPFKNYMVPYALIPEVSASTQTSEVMAVAPLPASTTIPNPGFPCSHVGCTKSFKRDADRIRHENAIHLGQKHFCPVIGCPKSTGNGYSRADKVVEHMRKKH